MRIFKNRCFDRFAEAEAVSDSELKDIIQRIETGQSVFPLGGNVYKVRVARPGKGKSGGYRVIVFFKSDFRSFFVYGFAKSTMDNISPKDLEDFKRAAKQMFSFTEAQIQKRIDNKVLKEVQ